MNAAAVQTVWAELIATTLADAGVTTCVISPGSRSTPLVTALAGEPRFELVTIIDERAAAFYALGAARATGKPAAVVCTSGTAAAHYLPALVEASMAGVPLLAITADRPPELQACGASQTIDQIGMYGHFVRGAFDLGAPVGQELALRSVRRKLVQALTLACGPHPGPVHVEVPLRKPLEPALPHTDEERAFAAAAVALRGPLRIAAPTLAPDPAALDALAAAIAAEPDGIIVAGALPAGFAREALFAFTARAGYPVFAEAGSQLRFGARPDGVVMIDHADLIPLAQRPTPRSILQLGAEPVAASWPGWLAATRANRYVLAGASWSDSDNAAALVVLGDVAGALAGVTARLRDRAAASPWLATWRDAEARAAAAIERSLAQHARSEAAVMRAAVDAVPAGGAIQIGNSLPIRVVDQVCTGSAPRTVLTQRGAAGIDGLIASAAGATRAGQPVLLVLGDVSFAHDVGGLLAARCATAPLAVVVIDNRGGQIFSGLPVARANLGAAFERHFTTTPELDPSAVATAFGARAITAASPAAVGTAVAAALATPGLTVIHAPVSASGAHDVRRTAIELYGGTHEQAEQAR
jgi:2-succinyl-5-enolpyruvyl-6-hydroxy-3-cyclohexene-1-carboxylate synthase